MAELQPELVDLVLKHLITLDTPLNEVAPALLNCCLVSHTWRAFAQPLLFSEVLRRYPTRGLSKLSDKLVGTLSTRSYLTKYITSLVVDIGDLSDLSRKRLFDLIPHVHELFLVARSSPTVKPDLNLAHMWANIRPSSRLTTLCLSTVDDIPIEILYHLSALKRLHLIDVGMRDVSREDGSLDSDFCPVETKTIKLSDLYFFTQLEPTDINLLHWFLNPQCAFDLSELSTCHIIYIPSNPDSDKHNQVLIEQFFLSVNTHVIRDIAFAPPPNLLSEESNFPRYEAFRNFSSLRSVKLVLDESSKTEKTFIEWVVLHFLPQLPHPDQLEELLIPLSFGDDASYDASLASSGWSSLDSLLSLDSGTFSNLNRVQIVLYHPKKQNIYLRYHIDAITFKRSIRSLLPRLDEKGILQVGFSPLHGFMSRSERRYECPFESD
ncbi:hypothetical protein BDN72DRAFT_958008 [Pluteus cervinus]|uniref:Uncharacterized protein n=1 Tax=Pluteus cervinus TaxID=181527 RepID=A0ACD3B0T5_9AGAR|nr:hypothetical protein BDN72DRAFT_958008 [Pluteus cervinus]